MTERFDLLRRLVAEADLEELPDLIAALAGSGAAALARLVTPAAPAESIDGLVDAAGMADILGTPENWVRDAGRAGRIPTVKLGHYVRFNPAEVLAAVRKMKPGSHNGGLCGAEKSKERRGGNRRVSKECPSSGTEIGRRRLVASKPVPMRPQAGRSPKHGARALSRHLRAGKLDRRTIISKELEATMEGLAVDRGGLANCNQAERLLIETAACEALICRTIAVWAFKQPTIIEARNGDGPRLLGPLAKGYTSHAAQLTRTLTALGVRPDKVDRLPSLQEYLTTKASADNGTEAEALPVEDDAEAEE